MSPRLGAYGDAAGAHAGAGSSGARVGPLHARVHDRAGLRAQPRRHHHRDVPNGHRRAAHAHDGGPGAGAARDRTWPCRRSTSRRFRSTCAPPATTRPTAPRPTTSSACRSPSGTRSAATRTGATAPTRASRSSRCSISRSRTRARSSRRARRARASRSSPIRRSSTVPPYYPDTPLVREELARVYDNIADMDAQVGEILEAARRRRAGGEHDRLLLERSRRRRAELEAIALRLRPPRAADDPLAESTRRDGGAGQRARRARQLRRSGADGPRARRRRDPRRISRAACFVGPKAAPAPPFVFAARDRMDIEYDMMRSARDGRFLYIRNFSPELPYAGHIIYRNQSAIMQEWLRLQAERKLTRAGARSGCGPSVRPKSCTTRPPIRIRSTTCRRIRRTAPRSTRMRERGHGVDGANRRSGPDQRARDDPADVARRRAARNRAALHRAAPRRPDAPARPATMTIRGADGDRHLRADPGRLRSATLPRTGRRRSGGSTPDRSSSIGR